MKHYGDVSKINGAEVEPVDVITFGSPCQDLSVAGKRMGLKHSAMGDEETTRSGLFFEAIRIIKEMREATNNEYPKYAVYENVSGAFSSNKGHDFHAVLEALCTVCDDTVSIPKPYDTKRTKLVWNKSGEIVGDNYSIAWRTLDAQYWGVPQRRKRIYLVADFTGRCAGEILFKQDGLRRDMQTGNETGQEATADAVGGVDGSSGVECLILNDQGGSSINIEVDEISPTLRANSHQHEPVIALQANAIDRADTAGCSGACYPLNEQVIMRHRSLGNGTGFGAGDDGDPAYTLQANHPHAVCFEPGAMVRDMGNRVWDGQSPTLRANMGDNQPAVCYQDKTGALQARDYKGVGNQYVGENKLVVECYDARGNGDGETACTITGDHQNRITDYTAVAVQETKPPRKYIIRRLLPVECARLQGFPDWWSSLAPYNPADADFWEQVRKTHAEINGKKYKPVKNLKGWYDKLHTDSAEYKAYGNGLALPCAEYVIHGIAEQGAKTLGSLFDGIGGFPLAGVLNGITPLWASEVEPYCIAVTKSRFKEVNNGK